MNILSINNYPNNTNFKAGWKNIKVARGVNCACCGGKMIDGIDTKKAYAATTKPLLKMIEKGYLSKWSDKLPIWNVLLQQAQNFPKLSLDKILLNSDCAEELKKAIKRCVNPNNEEYTKEINKKYLDEQEEIVMASRSEMSYGKTIINRFKSFRVFLKEDEKEVFDLLEYYTDLYPRATLSEIINNEDVLNLHKGLHIRQRNKTERIRNLHFNRIDKMIEKNKPEAMEHFKEVREKAMRILLRDFDYDANFYEVKKLYNDELEAYGLQKIVHKVMDEIKEMPIKNRTADSFFGFAAFKKMNDGEIINYLLKPSNKTFDHYLAYSKGGKNESGNGILLCHKCNQMKSSIGGDVFAEYHPLMPYYAQKQVEQISNLILTGKMDSSFATYPLEIASTYEVESKGKIKIDSSDYCKRSERKIKREQKIRDEQEKQHRKELEEIKKQQKELTKKLKKLEGQFKDKRTKLNHIKNDNQKDQELLAEIQQYLENQNK